MRIFVINGFPRSGKDTFVELCKKHFTNVFNISSVDYVKDMARKMGWNGKKDPKSRKFLSDLKDALTAWDDVPFKKIIERVDDILATVGPLTEGAIFIHCREPKEIEKLRKELDADTILVRRECVEEAIQSNHADEDILNYDYNIYILNNDDLAALELIAIDFINQEVKYK